MQDLRAHDVDILTIGQYLRPSFQHLPIQRYVPLEEYAVLKAAGKQMGFRHVEAGPFVRSSYHAHEQAEEAVKE
jgi:lipoic acid synthetase